MTATMVAVDLGAQSGRVALGRFDGERLSVSEVHRFPNVPVRTRGTLHWDILRLYQDVLDGLRAAGRAASRVDSIAVDSWAVDFGLIDRAGRLIQTKPAYGGAIVSVIMGSTTPQLATVRSRMFDPLEPRDDVAPEVRRLELAPLPEPRVRLAGHELHMKALGQGHGLDRLLRRKAGVLRQGLNGGFGLGAGRPVAAQWGHP